jgi:hypothetical protein
VELIFPLTSNQALRTFAPPIAFACSPEAETPFRNSVPTGPGIQCPRSSSRRGRSSMGVIVAPRARLRSSVCGQLYRTLESPLRQSRKGTRLGFPRLVDFSSHELQQEASRRRLVPPSLEDGPGHAQRPTEQQISCFARMSLSGRVRSSSQPPLDKGPHTQAHTTIVPRCGAGCRVALLPVLYLSTRQWTHWTAR